MLRWLFLAQAEQFDVRTLSFPGAGGKTEPWVFTVFTAALILMLVVGMVLLVFQRRRVAKTRVEHQQVRLAEMLTELNLGKGGTAEIIELMADTPNPTEQLALMESRPTFERRVKAFRERNPEHAALRRVGALRQRLGFGFGNIRVPFSDTRMLAAGQRLQCKIPHPKREITFVTAVMATSENQFWIRPPSSKGKPVSLERFPELGFRVSRENDAEYEFTCKVTGQAPTAMRAVALTHTDQIRRLFFRNAPRIAVDMPSQFYVVRQEAADKAHALLRARDSQYVVRGKLLDLSVGGALAAVPLDEMSPHEGDTLIFHLTQAQIREDLVAAVVRTKPIEGGQLKVHLQFAGLKELDRLNLNKYLTNLTAAATPAPPGGSATQPT